MKYVLKFGTYYLYDDDDMDEKNILHACDEIAICFSKDDMMFTLHKHGNPEYVNKWMEEAKKKYTEGGYPDIAKDLTSVQGKFLVEEINKIINNTGYIRKFLKDNGLLEGT